MQQPEQFLRPHSDGSDDDSDAGVRPPPSLLRGASLKKPSPLDPLKALAALRNFDATLQMNDLDSLLPAGVQLFRLAHSMILKALVDAKVAGKPGVGMLLRSRLSAD